MTPLRSITTLANRAGNNLICMAGDAANRNDWALNRLLMDEHLFLFRELERRYERNCPALCEAVAIDGDDIDIQSYGGTA